MRGTTPTHTFTVPIDTDAISKVKVIYAQEDAVLFAKDTEECGCKDGTITVKLTQADTLKFDCKKPAQIQMRILTQDGEALLSDIAYTSVGKCLDNEVIA